MHEYSNEEIIECLKNRQGHAVNYLFDKYLPMIRLLVYKMGGTGEDAKDVFQDALLIIITKIDQGNFSLSCQLGTFLYSICSNRWKDIIDKRKAAANYLIRKVDDNPDQDFTEAYDNKLYENLFYDMFDSLDSVCKKILRFYWQDQSPVDIAKKLGYSYNYVRKKKCECQSELVHKVNRHSTYISIRKRQTLMRNSTCN